VVNGGDYDGYHLSYHEVSVNELGSWTFGVYVLQDQATESKPIVIDRYGTSGSGFGTSTFEQKSVIGELLEGLSYRGDLATALAAEVDFDTTASIPEFDDDHDQIDAAGRRYILEGLGKRSDNLTGIDITTYPVVASVDEGNMYMVPVPDDGDLLAMSSRFFTQREDGRLLIYDLDYSFWDEASTGPQVPDASLNDGSTIGDTYFRGALGGCGIYPVTNVVDAADVGALTAYGTTNIGQTIWIASDYSLAHYEGLRQTWIYRNLSGDDYEDLQGDEAHGAAIAGLLAEDPASFFFYEDNFGRLVQFTKGELGSGGECGKPVIYLYPEQEMRLEVYVEPKGGFSYTEPEYVDGWRVSTTPDSVITNLDDGLVYPYLFWEGRGDVYTAPEEYWVVEDNEVPKFLSKILRHAGFVDREVADFLEFWLPRMEDAPYYKIGFHGTAVMDEIAPLSLSVEPDSILRILMDFEELQEEEPSNPPRLRPFSRRGFVVTEWGGVLR
jgi:hypothetical protein